MSDSTEPEVEAPARRTGSQYFSLVTTRPISASEWPDMYLVPAWIETSTPCANGTVAIQPQERIRWNPMRGRT